MEDPVKLTVEGMDCANCAQTITRTLQKSGLNEVRVNFVTGEVNFEQVPSEKIAGAINQINNLGYRVVGRSDESGSADHNGHDHHAMSGRSIEIKFFISLAFTIPLLLHMLFPESFLRFVMLQLALCLPVIAIGIAHFGKSAWKSLRAGVPNMDVLIMLGSLAAFVYSLTGSLLYAEGGHPHQYMFYDTAASIITLVLLGNLLEQRSVKQTTTALHELTNLQASKAKKVISVPEGERIEDVETTHILKGDILQVNTGDKIPVDGKIIRGEATVNEAMLTGESMPVRKETGMEVTGSTLVEDGSFRMIAEKVGSETALSKIIELVKNAQHNKPPIQKLGDRISAIFVPVVIGIALITFLAGHFFFDRSFSQSLMNSIAVLVISCPCAMGLATPTAVMVGLGRAARHGILIKGGTTLEYFSSIRTVVFDKTGTLTTGKFRLGKLHVIEGEADKIKAILYALEQHSSHPIATSIVKELDGYASRPDKISFVSVEEDKGIGINARDQEGNLFSAGSFQMVKHFYEDHSHSVYLLKNNKLIATLDLEDEVKAGAASVVKRLQASGIRVVMVSGDRESVCKQVSQQVGIAEYFSEQHPKKKLELISSFSKKSPTVMVGDGINDAPALAQATIGISMSDATQVAIQSSQVILLRQSDLNSLLTALAIGRMTYETIRQNLFWAFFYNVIAIPIAAMGYLSPIICALSMAFSDVIVIGNSLRLKIRKIDF